MAIRISEHFRKNWIQRVGGEPEPAQICQILGRSLMVQAGGGDFVESGRHLRTLSIYWSPADGVIIKVDPVSGTAVTVLSAAMQRKVVAA